ncbi:MAG: NAD(P)-binding protein [Lachnospiraceae bacterium]|nr:NAD(P)-binding protein [Lachnospiraceae bacterium]
MIKITQLKLPISHSLEDLERKIRKTLKLDNHSFLQYEIAKRSIDARKKPDLYYVYTVYAETKQEQQIVKRVHLNTVSCNTRKQYQKPCAGDLPMRHRPVIVGAGPAGLFCAYLLTEMGYQPLVLERGSCVDKRQEDVSRFWEMGILDTKSNVQFGEGGAGTFSDGKLNTAVKDPNERNGFVLDTFIRFGAPDAIRYEAKPHIGTDILAQVILNMRKYLEGKGCTFLFDTCLTDLIITENSISQIRCDHQIFDCDVLVLAPGHSARDTFRLLRERRLDMSAKNFAVGFRVEHPQKMIDEAMYGSSNLHLPAAPYKVTSNFPGKRGVYSFCMCPGGYVVNASSVEKALVVNGMSYSGRSGANANSAIIVSVGPGDFGADDCLAGMRYQQALEEKAFALGEGKIPQQLYGDFRQNIESTGFGSFSSQTKGKAAFANLRGLMGADMEESFCLGMEHFDRIIPGFAREDAILSGIESRTSSPIRIERNAKFESNIRGIYPCGEGAGYAGGIMSAAMDGLKVAEAIITAYRPCHE